MVNSKWGPWEIIGQSGAGGQGDVFKVRHNETGKVGALKRLKNPKRINRFEKEIQAVRSLEHPNVVPLIDANVTETPYYAVFEFEPGGALDELDQDELASFPIGQRIAWCEQIANALEAAHAKGLVHRDVKPANILLSTDRRLARLCDFGLVHIQDGERVTATEEQVGSRYFIAPECEEGRVQDVSPATDLYSLGKVLYYLVSGGKMFPREKQREERHDLPKLLSDPYLEHFARLIDRVVKEDLGRGDISAFQKQLSQARRNVIDRLPCAGIPETYRCVFCGQGTYQPSATSGNGAHNEGYGQEGNIGSQFMAFYECNRCGNCQRFKVKVGGAHWFPREYAEYQGRR